MKINYKKLSLENSHLQEQIKALSNQVFDLEEDQSGDIEKCKAEVAELKKIVTKMKVKLGVKNAKDKFKSKVDRI